MPGEFNHNFAWNVISRSLRKVIDDDRKRGAIGNSSIERKQVRWQPVGTGPYYLDFVDVNSRIVLKRHKDYFRGPAPIQTIVFQIIKDESTATIALRRGEVDLVMRSSREENIETLIREGFKMNKGDGYAVNLRIFNTKHKILSDLRVRQAMAHAVDFASVIKATSPVLQERAHSMLMPWMDVYTPNVPRYEFKAEDAVTLIRGAGGDFCSGFDIVGRNAVRDRKPRTASIQRRMPTQANRLIPLLLDVQLPIVCAVLTMSSRAVSNIASVKCPLRAVNMYSSRSARITMGSSHWS